MVLLQFYRNKDKGVLKALIAQGVIFGADYLSGIFVGSGITALYVAIDVAAMAILWGIIYFITQNIWIVIGIHMFWDVAESYISQESNLSVSGISGLLVSAVVSVAFLVLSLILYRKHRVYIENVANVQNWFFK